MSGQAIPDRLLEILVCPACHGAMGLDGSELVCAGCRLAYRVEGGVPIMLPEEGRSLAEGEADG